MGHWIKISPTQGKLVFGRRAWMWAIPFLLLVIPSGLTGLPGEPAVIVGWALAATFSWHLLCVRHSIAIDKNRGVLIHSLSSLYPIARLEVPLDEISGFYVSRAAFERRRYSVMMSLSNGQRICLVKRGGRQEAERQGRYLADFCQRPLKDEVREGFG